MDACCTRFTAAEGGARLAAVAGVKNTLAVEHSPFVATRLLHEHAYMIRGSLFDGQQRSIYVTRAARVACVAYELSILTDLSVLRAEKYDDVYDWHAELDKKEVLVCTSAIFREILEREILAMTNVNILILDSCHLICKDDDLKYVMNLYKECPEEYKPRILGLTYPLFTSINKDKCVEKSNDSNGNEDNDHSKEGVDKIGPPISSIPLPTDSEEKSTLVQEKIEIASENKLDSATEASSDIKSLSITQVDLKNEDGTKEILKNEMDVKKEIENLSNSPDETKSMRDNNKELKDKCDNLKDSRSKSYFQEEPENIIIIHEDFIPKDDIQVVPAAKSSTQEEHVTKGDNQEVPTAKSDNQEDITSKGVSQEDLKSNSKTQEVPKPKSDSQEVPTAKSDNQEEDTITKGDTQEDSKINSKIQEVSTPKSDTQEVPTAKSDNQEILTTKGDTQENPKNKSNIQEVPMVKIDTQEDPNTKSDIEKHPTYDRDVQEGSKNKSDIIEETRSQVDNEQNKIDSFKSNQANSHDINDVTEEIKTQKAKDDDILGENIGIYKNLDDFDMYEKLEWRIEQLEKELCSQMDLAEDIDSGKRLSASITKPKELIIEYSGQKPSEQLPEAYVELDKYMRDTVNDAMDFLNEHRYDPSEIYGEDLYEEFMNIPNPTIDPKHIFNHFLYVLDQLGPYAADKAAFSLLTKLEKLKIKVPYERHFLLLCLCTSVFVKIRCYADLMFSKYESDWTKIQFFCTPKVLRFVEILEKFQPPESQKSNETTTNNNTETTKINNDTTQDNNNTETTKINNDTTQDNNKTNSTTKMLNEIENCDFITLSNKIEDKVNTYKANLKEIVDLDVEFKKNEVDSKKNDLDNNKIGTDSNKSEMDCNTMELKNQLNMNENQSNMTENHRNKNELNTSQNELNTNQNQFNMNQNQSNMNENELHVMNTDNTDNKSDVPQQKTVLGFPRRQGHRTRGRGRVQRNNAARAQQMQQNPDALCGIVFVKEPLMAKILFMLIVDMSRCHPKLSYLCTQYCASEKQPDCSQEPRECQRQARKQEDVLKKFRMHECNLLLATSALEEGIDLPRCNLVLRWDVPPSYRSYGLCRDRARAPRAACVLLSYGSRDNTDALLHNVATYRELDQIISRKCGCGIQDEPPQEEESHADNFTRLVKSYTPNDNNPVDHKKTDNSDVKSNTIDEKDNTIDENNDKNHADINNEVLKKEELKIQNPLRQITEIEVDSSKNVTDDNEIKCNEKHDSNMKSDNLFCNKCNKKRISVYVECPCVSVVNVSVDSGETGCNYRDNHRNKADIKRSEGDSVASVDMNSAIALINRYCGKLPSDTFTRLAPQWWMEEVQLPARGSNATRRAYICTLRLPLNCPVKYNIVGHPMPTRVLARRMVALQACRILHKSGELDDQLMPIGKENFKAADLDIANGNFGNNNGSSGNGDTADPNDCARPGTTKRRQYYFKRTAWAFTDCQPVVDTSDSEIYPPKDEKPEKPEIKTESNKDEKNGTKRNMLYAVVSKLWCALPERYNTRGRRLHAPQNASQAIGILMARDEPDDLQIPAFPVYTRSGEVRVSVEYVPDADVRMSPRRGRLVRRFMRFVFAEVLRVRRRGMRLQSEGSTHNNYYIVPTVKTTRGDGSTKIDIDWAFLELIYQHTEEKKHSELEKPILWHQDEEEKDDAILEREKTETTKGTEDGKVKKMENPLLKPGETFVFDPDKYREAVVTPWYRNQDQPQFFLVAEICWNLTPDSAFPSDTHTTFRNYYSSKYGVELTQSNQPLLDVDHTSARLNLLTPRYVNRKGVALPVSSERTRRAKRDRLDQKQILVPELCRVHPFAAPLWFATVVLPCVLYRINALLTADEIRRAVAIDVGLGIPKIDEDTRPGFQWPPLDFGWSLAEVLNADQEKNEKKKEEEDNIKREDIGNENKNSEEKENGEWTQKEKEDEEKMTEEPKEKTINDILQEKEQAESAFEIGTWSNEMASSIPQPMEYDEFMEPLPPNLTFCTSASGGSNWCDPIQKPKNQFNPSRTFSMADSDCSYMSSDFDTDDSDLNSEGSDGDTDTSGFWSGKNSNATMGVRIEYKTAHEAEAVDLERSKSNPAPQPDVEDDALDRSEYERLMREGVAPAEYVEKFRRAVSEHEKVIVRNGHLIEKDAPITEVLPETHENPTKTERETDVLVNKLSKIDFKSDSETKRMFDEIFPYGTEDNSNFYESGRVTLENIERNKRILLNALKNTLSKDEIKKLNCFSMIDVDIDSPSYVNEKVVNVGFDTKDNYIEKISKWDSADEFKPYYTEGKVQNGKEFDFDYQPNLEGHPGPSPSVILQALTMSNANDGINLERLETIGDSFLKFAITAHLYCALPAVHEGKLSHMRSKQVSNLNLYRLGRNKRLGARMIASKFEPHDNWLPPCHKPPPALQPGVRDDIQEPIQNPEGPLDNSGCFIPYNLITQHSIPDKSIADCVEALIGAYLLECGPRGALLFMSWLGISVLPRHDLPLPDDHPYLKMADAAGEQKPPPPPTPKRQRRDCTDSDSECSSDDEGEPCAQREEPGPEADWSWPGRPVGSLRPYKDENGRWMQPIFGELKAPPSPLLRYIEDPEGELEQMLSGYDALERTLQYRFKDRSLLLQALTHASHQRNRLTDCYQRLEFLGDAILDYLITRHLYEDPRRHSPGALTDLRSALVNNTIFATLAARHGFHKYFRHMSPGLNEVLTKYVKIQEENGHSISEEHYLIQEDEMEQAEDVEVPKALGDLFESVAGAIFLDSGMSLGAVWKSYVNLMGAELEAFSAAAPKSPVRELLEAEPDTAKFGKPERLADGRRVRVCVEVFGRGAFKGVGRNYRIAKGTAARCALRHLRRKRQH